MIIGIVEYHKLCFFCWTAWAPIPCFCIMLCYFVYDMVCIWRLCRASFFALQGVVIIQQGVGTVVCFLTEPHQSFCTCDLLRWRNYFRSIQIKKFDFFCRASILLIPQDLLLRRLLRRILAESFYYIRDNSFPQAWNDAWCSTEGIFCMSRLRFPLFWTVSYVVVRQTHSTNKNGHNWMPDKFYLLNPEFKK